MDSVSCFEPDFISHTGGGGYQDRYRNVERNIIGLQHIVVWVHALVPSRISSRTRGACVHASNSHVIFRLALPPVAVAQPAPDHYHLAMSRCARTTEHLEVVVGGDKATPSPRFSSSHDWNERRDR